MTEGVRTADVDNAILALMRVINAYQFVVFNEADLQTQLMGLLEKDTRFRAKSEVIGQRGRYDIHVQKGAIRIVLELKAKGSAAEVERQAQKYALTDGVDAVMLITTSSRLAAQLRTGGSMLGGKRFVPIALRSF